jgi:hypothetical protein
MKTGAAMVEGTLKVSRQTRWVARLVSVAALSMNCQVGAEAEEEKPW